MLIGHIGYEGFQPAPGHLARGDPFATPVDEFLDVLHNSSGKYIPKDVVVEPFIKERDYRGIFRIIE